MKDLDAVVTEDEKRLTFMKAVDRAISLDKKMKANKKELDAIKAVLQAEAYSVMENRNLKWYQIFGSSGHFNAAYKEKFELDDYHALMNVLGEKAEAKVVRKVEVKYDVADRLKEALIVLFRDDYDYKLTVEEVLTGLGLDAKTIKTTAKKLKGDYLKDKAVLEAVGITGPCEEELDAIRQYRNWELVDKLLGTLTPQQTAKLKKAIFVEDSLSAGLEYEKE